MAGVAPPQTTAPSPTRPRKAAATEARAIAETLAAAFFDDPVIGWAWHDPGRRRQILPAFFELMAATSIEHDQAFTTDDLAGAALWLPPAALQTSEDQVADFAVAVEQVTYEFAPAVQQLFAILDDQHPHQPHYYLPIIGTRPSHQGQGIGSSLLAPVLAACDHQQLPAYLEATSQRNLTLYLRHGFRVTGELPLPEGPSLWPMWREPQPGYHGRARAPRRSSALVG